MRVLLVSDFFPPVVGGLEFHVKGLARELADRGVEVLVATLTTDPCGEDGFRVQTIASAARLLPHDRADRPFHPPVPDPVARRSLRRILAEFKPHIIHGHSWSTVSLPSRERPPLVYTAHDYGLVCQLRTLVKSDGSLCDGPSFSSCVGCGASSYGRGKSLLMTTGTIAGRKFLRPDAIVAVSAAVHARLGGQHGVPIHVIPNFVQPESILEPLPPDIPEGLFAMYAGDPGAHKGIDDLVEAWTGPSAPSADLVLATPIPYRAALPDRVVNISLSRGQVASAWRRASMAIVPSRWADPCPTVVLEAMRAGIPIVGTDRGGIPELVRDGVDGLLVPSSDPEALRTAVRSLIDDAGLRERLGASAFERAHRYSAERVGGEILDLYVSLLAEQVRAS